MAFAGPSMSNNADMAVRVQASATAHDKDDTSVSIAEVIQRGRGMRRSTFPG